MSLRRRLTLLSALAVAAAVALTSAIVYFLVRDRLESQIDETLKERAGAAALVVGGRPVPIGEAGRPPPGGPPPGAAGGPPPGTGRPAPPGEPPGGNNELRLPPPPLGEFVPRGQLIDANGSVELARGGSLPVSDEAKQVAMRKRGPTFSTVDVGGSELRVLTVPAAPEMALQIARPLDEVNNTLADLLLILGLVTLGGVALGAGMGLLVTRTSLAPVAAVAGAAQEVAKTKDLTRRIEVHGDDELGRMAGSFNEMMAALERSVGAQRRLVADASHELRTPLATLRTNIETLAQGDALSDEEKRRIVSDLSAEMEELSRIVGDVVELAREPSEQTAISEQISLDELAAAAVDRARRRARDLRFEQSLEPATISGDPSRLDRAIANLLDNAIKWSPEGGEIEVTVKGGRVSVRDHGPGFAAEDLPRAFERFYRADEARGMPGSGLGLAIVRRIAEEHGGAATAGNAPGGGAVVELALPLADS
ncbi:MAG: sensor histidine kinase [Solirubrobacterales bacterium]